jgi:catechol 2,3-dioxygenase-like lactoylglutathione lyase family enzyme
MSAVSGLHHIKIPVSDLDTSIDWYRQVFAAQHISRFDHHDSAGARYGVVIMIPGLATPVELRLAPKAAMALAGYDPLTFAVTGLAELEDWIRHLDGCGIQHSPIIRGFIGHVISFADPDGLVLRLYTEPVGGFDVVEFGSAEVQSQSDWVNSELMSYK